MLVIAGEGLAHHDARLVVITCAWRRDTCTEVDRGVTAGEATSGEVVAGIAEGAAAALDGEGASTGVPIGLGSDTTADGLRSGTCRRGLACFTHRDREYTVTCIVGLVGRRPSDGGAAYGEVAPAEWKAADHEFIERIAVVCGREGWPGMECARGRKRHGDGFIGGAIVEDGRFAVANANLVGAYAAIASGIGCCPSDGGFAFVESRPCEAASLIVIVGEGWRRTVVCGCWVEVGSNTGMGASAWVRISDEVA